VHNTLLVPPGGGQERSDKIAHGAALSMVRWQGSSLVADASFS
jgi:hypothetical protein